MHTFLSHRQFEGVLRWNQADKQLRRDGRRANMSAATNSHNQNEAEHTQTILHMQKTPYQHND